MDVLDIFLLYWDRLFYTCFLLQGVSPGMVDWTSKTRLRWVRKLPIEPIAFELSTFQVDEFLDFWQSTLNPAALALVQNVLMYKLFFRYFSAISVSLPDINTQNWYWFEIFHRYKEPNAKVRKIVFLNFFSWCKCPTWHLTIPPSCFLLGTHF